MKRWILYAGIVIGIAVFGTSSLRGIDIGKLAPVEVVWLAEENGQVYLETDTGDAGRGENVHLALEDMKAAAPGYVFLETADYLIVQKGSEGLLDQVYDVLRPPCMVCVAEDMPDIEHVAAFLEVHESAVTLRQCRVQQQKLPILQERDGRFEWIAE